MELTEVINKYKEWLIMEDTTPLKILLATALTKKSKNIRLYCILVGNSGSAKTDLINSLDDDGENTIKVLNIKPSALGSGRPTKNDKSLISKLVEKSENGIILLINELAPILNSSLDAQSRFFSALRTLSDGEIIVDSDVVHKEYKNLNVTIIGASTPDIYNKSTSKDLMGTREMYIQLKEEDKVKIKEKIKENLGKDKNKFMNELKKLVKEFLDSREFKENLEIFDEISDKIGLWAELVTKLRAPAEINANNGELINNIYPERNTRVREHFLSIFKALKGLDEKMNDEECLEIIKRLALSNCYPRRLNTLLFLIENYLYEEKGYTCRKVGISDNLRISKNSASGELNALFNLDLATKTEEETSYPDRPNIYFKANANNEIIKFLAKEMNIQLELEVVKI